VVTEAGKLEEAASDRLLDYRKPATENKRHIVYDGRFTAVFLVPSALVNSVITLQAGITRKRHAAKQSIRAMDQSGPVGDGCVRLLDGLGV